MRAEGFDYVVTRQGAGLRLVCPMNAAAREHLRAHASPASPDVTWYGEELVVEYRYMPELASSLVAAGFTVYGA